MPHKVPFRVVHVSGQDENFKAVELNSHSPTVKGWQSCKFCLYPQDIVIYMEQKCRLRKIQILVHQYLIPTKIEFFTGDVPDGVPHSLQNARYTRLGYVSFSDNEKTGFRARELKSVHVDAVGIYIKLVVHKNYINKHNLYNQVGVVAINVIGDEILNPFEINRDAPIYDVSAVPGKEDFLLGNFRRSDYISPMEDLAFDMYQDPEVASLCRKLDKKKQKAVMDERYDYAKRLRDGIIQLHKCGEKLGRLEVEKRQAIECENYEAAKVKKIQMDEYRLKIYRELDIGDLMEETGPGRFPEMNQRLTPPPSHHTPLPPLSPSPPPQHTARTPSRRSADVEPLPDEDASPRGRSPYVDPEDRPLPALRGAPREEPPPPADDDVGPLTGEPEKMSERDMREAAAAIEVFGLPLVSKAYSKTWSHREDAFLELHKRLQEAAFASDKDEVKANFRAAVFLLQRGVKDMVFAVFNAVVNLNKFLLTDFVDSHQIPKPDVHYAVDKILPPLHQRIGETAIRLRDVARQQILDMSHWHQVSQFQSFYTECLRPFRPVAEQRLALGKTELVGDLYHDNGISSTHHGITIDNLMNFLVAALEHKAGTVREAAEKVIIDLYAKTDKNAVRSYLPPDTNKTRKNTLYRHLFEAFDRVDGKPSKEEQARQAKADEAKKNAQKQKEIEELQAQLQELRNLTGPGDGKTPRQGKQGGKPAQQPSNKKPPPEKSQPTPAPAPAPAPAAEEPDETLLQLENTCIFCGERSEDFTEEGLDVHYWKNCPMLRRCANCKQVVEIATLTEHLLTECEAKDNFAQCPRCTEAIPKSEYDQHVREKLCNPGQDKSSHCPLCHENFTPGDDDWKNHLMGPDGCKQNPRRVAAINNQGKPNKGGGAKRSQLPKPTNRTGAR